MKLALHPLHHVVSVQLSVMYPLLSFLLLSSFGLATGFRKREGCSASSFGQVQNIRYPFCLRSDPADSGLQEYQLLCDVSEFANEVRFPEPLCGRLAVHPIADAPLTNSS